MREIKGNLVTLAKDGHFDIIAHGCNCFNTMGAGIAPQIAKAFAGVREADNKTTRGDIMKLGNYTIANMYIADMDKNFSVINIYSQYRYGRNHEDGDKHPFDSEAFSIALRKINHNFKGKTIGLPLIGAGLAGGNWDEIKKIIETELKDMDVWIVHYDKT